MFNQPLNQSAGGNGGFYNPSYNNLTNTAAAGTNSLSGNTLSPTNSGPISFWGGGIQTLATPLLNGGAGLINGLGANARALGKNLVTGGINTILPGAINTASAYSQPSTSAATNGSTTSTQTASTGTGMGTTGPSSNGYYSAFSGNFIPFGQPDPAATAGAKPVYDTSTGKLIPPTSIPPNNFGIDTSGGSGGSQTTISSSSAKPVTTSAALNAQSNKQSTMYSGTAPVGTTPSDQLYQEMMKMYQASLYSPEQQQVIQQYNQAQTNLQNDQMAESRQIQALQQNGQITQAQADQMLQDTKNRWSSILSADTGQANNASTAMNTLAMLQKNQIGAISSVLPFYQGTAVSPGSTLVNQFGQTLAQGQGASPAQINSTAFQLMNNDYTRTGTYQTNPDGSPNYAYYQNLATQMYQPGGMSAGSTNTGSGYTSTNSQSVTGTGSQGTTGTTSGTGSTNTGSGNYSTTPTMVPGTEAAPQYTAYSTAIAHGLPPPIAGATITSSVTGDTYVSGQMLSNSALQTEANALAGKSGIPFVPATNVGNVQQLDVVMSQLGELSLLTKQTLTPGLLGRIEGMTTNQLQSYFETSPVWAKFNAVRLSAINYLKAMAQGGGFRTNQSEINTASDSIANSSDNLESAQAKIQTALTNLNIAYKTFVPTHTDTTLSHLETVANTINSNSSSSSSTSSSSTGGTIVQTSAGAIPTNW